MEAIHEVQKLSPSVCGGDPCIVRTRIPVWLLERYRRLGVTERDLLDSYPTLRAEDLANVWAHARIHAAAIDDQLQANDYAPTAIVQQAVAQLVVA